MIVGSVSLMCDRVDVAFDTPLENREFWVVIGKEVLRRNEGVYTIRVKEVREIRYTETSRMVVLDLR